MDARFEVAVAGKHGSRDEIVPGDGFFHRLRQRTRIADAGGAAVADDLETELVEVGLESGGMKVVLHHPRTRSQRGLHRGGDMEPALHGLLGQESCAEHDARVARVGAAGDGGNDYAAVIQSRCAVPPRAKNMVRHRAILFHLLDLLLLISRHFETRMHHLDRGRGTARGRRLVVSAVCHRFLEE